MQEGKAEKAADAIKGMLSSKATVIRNGDRQVIEAVSFSGDGNQFLVRSSAVCVCVRACSLRLSQHLTQREPEPV